MVAVEGTVTKGPPASGAALLKATSGMSLARPARGKSLRSGKKGSGQLTCPLIFTVPLSSPCPFILTVSLYPHRWRALREAQSSRFGWARSLTCPFILLFVPLSYSCPFVPHFWINGKGRQILIAFDK